MYDKDSFYYYPLSWVNYIIVSLRFLIIEVNILKFSSQMLVVDDDITIGEMNYAYHESSKIIFIQT